MKKEHIRVVLVFLSFFLLNACLTVPSTRQSKLDQSKETIVPITTLSVRSSPPPTPVPTHSQPRLALPLGVSIEEMAYISNKSGMAEIWLLNLVTGTGKQLTETDCSNVAFTGGYVLEGYVPGVQYFIWAPDGLRIAYLATCTHITKQARLNVLDLETGSVIPITDRAGESSYPSWAPSGDRFIFTLPPDLMRRGMYVAGLNEQDEFEIEPIEGTAWEDCLAGCYNAVWSPGGRHIAYQGPYVGLGTGSRTYVSIVDLDGNHVVYEPAVDHRTPWIHEPSSGGLVWSNNGHYLAIATGLGRTGAHLVLAEVTDQAAIMAEAFGLWQHFPDGLIPFGSSFRHPVFSPDDKTLYFVSLWPDNEDINVPFGTIYSVPVHDLLHDSSPSPDVRIVSPEDQLTGYPSLSPDGEWLIYAVKVGEATEVWLQAVDGTRRQRLIADGFVNIQPAWRLVDK
jgi:Tol biopolymer transport system component